MKTNILNWTTSELFDFLQSNNIISEEDTFEDWMFDRTDMIQMVEYYLNK